MNLKRKLQQVHRMAKISLSRVARWGGKEWGGGGVKVKNGKLIVNGEQNIVLARCCAVRCGERMVTVCGSAM